MKTIACAASVLSLVLALAGSAAAQDRGRPASTRTAGGPDTTYDFEDDAVEGDYRNPAGERVVVPGRARRNTLIRPRAHFVPELTYSVERL